MSPELFEKRVWPTFVRRRHEKSLAIILLSAFDAFGAMCLAVIWHFDAFSLSLKADMDSCVVV